MTSAQFDSISSIEGVWYNDLHIAGSTVNLAGKTLSEVWRAGIDENVTVYANDMAKIDYIDAFNAVGDTLNFSGILSDLQRDEAHKAGYDTVIDSTGLSTTNLAPTVANLGGERKLVRPEEVVFLDTGGDAAVIDDRGTIKTITVEVGSYRDSVRILDTNRLTIDRRDDGNFYIVFDGERIGNGSRSSFNDGGLYFNFNDDAPAEAVDHVLHNIQFVRSRDSRHDTDVTVIIRDRGGKKAVADILMQGIDGPERGPSIPTIPTIPTTPSLPTEERPASTIKGGKGKDFLLGTSGKDKLYGYSGNDVLSGGAGADVFVFNTALGKGTTSKNRNKKVNYDTITDFKSGEDKIWLDNKIFKKLGKAGSEVAPASLNKKFFRLSKSKDKNDHIAYKKGVVYYDADGKGTKYKPVEIIKIANKAVLSAADFLVI
ncbi:hypothetical protein LGR44_05150 [Microvirga sp. SM9]|nr:hypothetical protein [Microvirga lenta]